ncbi:MAG: putative damage-inducible protein DinB [Pseudoalteromonas tetraodonis]|jgi:uncharacterized damage-inducible protein DinB
MEKIISDNLQCIGQAIDLLNGIGADLYSRASAETLGAGVGSHIRHNIDHYESFLNRRSPERIDYEDRQRDAQLETDPAAAYDRLAAVSAVLREFDTSGLDRAVEVKIENPGDRPESQWATTTGRRELQFLLSHTVHHYALIAMICRQHGAEMPDNFGVAPSTLRYRQLAQTAECAR